MDLFSYGKHPNGLSGLSFFECSFERFVKELLAWRVSVSP